MESCCSQLTPSAPQHNSFRIDNILTGGIGQSNNVATFNPHHLVHQPSAAGRNPPTHHHQSMTMFCKNEDINTLSHEIKRESISSVEEDEEGYRKKKKPRTAFSREQVAELEKKFTERKYLSSAERGELAQRLNLSDMQVKTWFQNRRMKFKRQTEEAELENKSPKFPYPPFVPATAYSSFYSYMPYKAATDPAVYGCTSPPNNSDYHPYSSSLILSSPPPHNHPTAPPSSATSYFNNTHHTTVSLNGSYGNNGGAAFYPATSCYQLGSYFTGNPITSEYGTVATATSQYNNGGDWSQRSSLSSPPSAAP